MATATVNPDPQITRTIITPDLSKPEIGQPTLIAFYNADHTVKLTVAHVLAIGPADAATGQPTLTVAYPAEPFDARKLGSVRWGDAYARVTGVQHYTHPDVKDGKLSIAWGGDGAIEVDSVPEIPQPEGKGSTENPIYQRQELQEPQASTEVNEAIIAQRGQAPEGSHLSPATSEAGETHDATVPAPSAPGDQTVNSAQSSAASSANSTPSV